jgi:hypothetical protein
VCTHPGTWAGIQAVKPAGPRGARTVQGPNATVRGPAGADPEGARPAATAAGARQPPATTSATASAALSR